MKRYFVFLVALALAGVILAGCEANAQQQNPYALAVVVGVMGFTFLVVLVILIFVYLVKEQELRAKQLQQPQQVVYLVQRPVKALPEDTRLTLRPIHAPAATIIFQDG